MAAGTVFELDGENKAVIIQRGAVADDALLAAAQSCPTRAILLFDENEKKVYPID